jgi:Ca-activated chloride channel family protein
MVQPLAPAEIAAAKILSIPAATTSIPTAFYDTVSTASKYLVSDSDDRHRRVILVISDGDDNFSNMVREASIAEYQASQKIQPTGTAQPKEKTAGGEPRSSQKVETASAARRRAAAEVQKYVQKADAAFYAINPGGSSLRLNLISMSAQNSMQSIAESTGGTAFVPNGEQDLERVFNEIAAELRGQYLLQYYSNSDASPGQFRTIKVGVPAHPEYRIRARQGYYPKGENPKAIGTKQ